jgi:hypothetical protein
MAFAADLGFAPGLRRRSLDARTNFLCAIAKRLNNENSPREALIISKCDRRVMSTLRCQAVMKKRCHALRLCARRRSHFYRTKFIPKRCCDRRKIMSRILAMTLASVQEK